MTKIKNFRITLRPRDMARWLKKERGLETTPELEVAIEQIAKSSRALIDTAAIYTTLPRQVAEKTTPFEFPKKAIATTLIAVSIGPAVETQRSQATDPHQESLLAALHHEALAQSLNFVMRLAQDQAKEEDCDLSPVISAADILTATTVATLLGVPRIGIDVDTAHSDIPSHARLAWLFWTPIGKGASRRAEKVAA